MLEEHIFHICNSDSLFSLADNLESFVFYLDTSLNKREDISALYQKIRVYEFYAKSESYPGYRVFNTQSSALKYLTNYWRYTSSARKDTENLRNIINRIKKSFVCMQQTLISIEKIKHLFSIVDEKYDFTNLVLGEKKVDILLLESTHKEWNSFYSATATPRQEVLHDFIMISSMPLDSVTNQEFCFMHELGHLLHTRITMNIEKVPESFEQFFAFAFPDGSHISDTAKVECFADFFAIAALLDTEYEPLDALHLDKSVKKALSEYMNQLIYQNFHVKEAHYA